MDKTLSTFAKLLLIGAGGLAVVAGPILFLFSTTTASYFAWAIKNLMTPIFMGANYFGGVGAIWAMRSNRWPVARVLLPGIFVFALTQLLATLLHLPIFNWSHPVAWAWLFVYLSSPVAAAGVWLQMERNYRPPAIPSPSLPRGFHLGMLLFAVINGAAGLALWLWPAVVPASAALGAVPWWAWSLTPLTARVVGGWYLAAAALYSTLSRPHPAEAVRVALFGVMCATVVELAGAALHWEAFGGPMVVVGLYLLNAAGSLGYALFTWFRMARVPQVSTA
jgi:hypothetical protein